MKISENSNNFYKSLLIISVLFSFFNTKAQKKKTPLGLKGGVNYSTYDGEIDPLFDAKYTRKFGYYLGIFTEIKLNDKLKLKPELFYSLRGSEILFENVQSSSVFGDEIWRINEKSISLPVIIQYNIAPKINLEAGPQFSSILGYDEKVIQSPNKNFEGTEFPEEAYDNLDVAIVAGIGFKLNEKFSITSRYVKGITERDARKVKTSVVNFGLEYKL